MTRHGWRVAPARWEMDPETGFFVWQEQKAQGEAHAVWVAEQMVRHLSAGELVNVLDREGVAEDLRISFRVQIQERGDEYRVRPAPRRPRESRRQD
jgi:hypothetical protein